MTVASKKRKPRRAHTAHAEGRASNMAEGVSCADSKVASMCAASDQASKENSRLSAGWLGLGLGLG